MKHERVQTGVRMEKRLVKVLKAIAELRDLSLGELLEFVVCRGFVGETPFTDSEVRQIKDLTRIYRLDLEVCSGASGTHGHATSGDTKE
jgi:hypothetical protein